MRSGAPAVRRGALLLGRPSTSRAAVRPGRAPPSARVSSRRLLERPPRLASPGPASLPTARAMASPAPPAPPAPLPTLSPSTLWAAVARTAAEARRVGATSSIPTRPPRVLLEPLPPPFLGEVGPPGSAPAAQAPGACGGGNDPDGGSRTLGVLLAVAENLGSKPGTGERVAGGGGGARKAKGEGRGRAGGAEEEKRAIEEPGSGAGNAGSATSPGAPRASGRGDVDGDPPPGAAAAPLPPLFDPFFRPEPALVVGALSPTHALLLNKFNVVAGHVLVVTRQFSRQESPLSVADLEATWEVLRACRHEGGGEEAERGSFSPREHPSGDGEGVHSIEGLGECARSTKGAGENDRGLCSASSAELAAAASPAPRSALAFFNCGPASGASQPHKHVQIVPLPLEDGGWPTSGAEEPGGAGEGGSSPPAGGAPLRPAEAPIEAVLRRAVAQAAAAARVERPDASLPPGTPVPVRELPYVAWTAEIPGRLLEGKSWESCASAPSAPSPSSASPPSASPPPSSASPPSASPPPSSASPPSASPPPSSASPPSASPPPSSASPPSASPPPSSASPPSASPPPSSASPPSASPPPSSASPPSASPPPSSASPPSASSPASSPGLELHGIVLSLMARAGLPTGEPACGAAPLGALPDGTPVPAPPPGFRSYNLLLTPRFALVVPRRKEKAGNVAANAVAYAGSLFARSEAVAAEIAARGAVSILAELAVPWDGPQAPVADA